MLAFCNCPMYANRIEIIKSPYPENNCNCKYNKFTFYDIQASVGAEIQNQLDTINETPNDIMYCIANIKKYQKMFTDNPIPLATTNPIIIMVDIKKFTPSLVTIDIGKISLGKYTFFIIFPLSIIVAAPLNTTLEKYCHGINAQHK